MPDAQLPLPLARPHNNHQLFSDYYLDEILPHRAGWEPLTSRSHEALTAVAAIFAGYAPSTNEAQTEHDFIRPVLEILGHHFEVQPALRTPAGPKRPVSLAPADTLGLTTISPSSRGSGSPGARKRVGTVGAARADR